MTLARKLHRCIVWCLGNSLPKKKILQLILLRVLPLTFSSLVFVKNSFFFLLNNSFIQPNLRKYTNCISYTEPGSILIKLTNNLKCCILFTYNIYIIYAYFGRLTAKTSRTSSRNNLLLVSQMPVILLSTKWRWKAIA